MNREIKIVSSGQYFPKNVVESKDLDKKLGLREGTVERKTGVKRRFYINDETNAIMAKYAINNALRKCNIKLEEIDCIVSTSGTMQQPIPSNASLIQKELGLEGSGIPCFDINSTCLSFLVGLELMSYPLMFGKYKNIVLVSSEISSVGLNFDNFESSTLFGDGAVAFIFSTSDKKIVDGNIKILAHQMKTYSSGANFTEIKGGGSYIHPREYSSLGEEYFTFNMDGKSVVKLSLKKVKKIIDQLLEEADVKREDIKYIVPHQASKPAMKLVGHKMGFSQEKIINIIENTGNVISASIPMAWHYLLENYDLVKGDKILLFGTSAGLSIAGTIIEIC